MSHFRVTLCSVSKQVRLQNFSYENEFYLYENEPVDETHFHLKWFCTKTRFDTGERQLGNGL